MQMMLFCWLLQTEVPLHGSVTVPSQQSLTLTYFGGYFLDWNGSERKQGRMFSGRLPFEVCQESTT